MAWWTVEEHRTLNQEAFTLSISFYLQLAGVDFVLFNQTNTLDRRERTLKIHAFNESFSSRIVINEHCTYSVSNNALDLYFPIITLRSHIDTFPVCQDRLSYSELVSRLSLRLRKTTI